MDTASEFSGHFASFPASGSVRSAHCSVQASSLPATERAEAGGKNCSGETLQMTISSVNYVRDGSIIMPEPQSGFGFVVSPNSSMAPRLQLNNPEIFGVINRDYIERAFYAAFI
jgi:hypothetical protein